MNVCLVCGRLYDDDVTHCPLDAEELLPHDPSLQTGATVAGRYTVLRAVGMGQTGELFEGREGDAGPRVVLKLLAEDLTRDRRTADALRRHLFKARELKHPNAVPIRAIEQHGERLLLVRDWVEGERLQDVLARESAWPVARAVALVEQVCTMLAAAHRMALLHLQIRPSNLFLLPGTDGGDERVVALDFGIGPLRRVGVREVYGTLRTLAPEQLEGKIPTFKSDIYSTGLLLHRLIVGTSAFSGTEAEVARKVLNDAPPPLVSPAGEEIPAALDALVRQMVEKRPVARPPTMAAVAERLQALRGSIPPSSPSAPPAPVEGARPSRRERATIVMQAVRPAAVPAPKPEPSPEEGTTQEIQPEIIETPPKRPPPRMRSRDAGGDGTVQEPPKPEVAADTSEAVPAVAATAKDAPATAATAKDAPATAATAKDAPATSPGTEPGFGTLPAAEGEPAAEQTIDVELDEPRVSRPAEPRLSLLGRLGKRERIYAAAAAGLVLLVVILVIAFAGGEDRSSRGADAVVVATTETDAAVDASPPDTVPADAIPTAAADATPEQTAAEADEVPEPADVPLDGTTDEAAGDVPGDVPGDLPGDVPGDGAADVEPEGAAAPEDAGDAGEPTAAELVARGNRALASRQLSRAKALYRQALDLEPGHRQARTGLGRVAFQQGQFEEAVRQLEPLYRNQGHMDLGVAYVRVGRRDDARRQFEKLLDRNPGNADARRALDALNR